MKNIRLIILLTILSFIGQNIFSQDESIAWQAKVQDRVFEEFNKSESVEIVVEFKEQADLSATKLISGKQKKENMSSVN